MKSKQPERWKKESKAIKATQVAFDISTEAQKQLKLKAIHNDLSPSDQMRQILGLPNKRPLRPRLTISLSSEDYEILAKQYSLKSVNKLAIKERAAKDIINNVMGSNEH
ncbi:MAG: hypothetical protein L3J46_11755 [Kangiellaceae bacterium]|nr:hypothetical protein [Kangiellaceae bacterium]